MKSINLVKNTNHSDEFVINEINESNRRKTWQVSLHFIVFKIMT